MPITHSLVIYVEDQEWKMSKEGDEASDSSLFSENQAGDAVCLPRAREFMSEHVAQLKKKWIPEPGTFEFSSSFVLGGGGGEEEGEEEEKWEKEEGETPDSLL